MVNVLIPKSDFDSLLDEEKNAIINSSTSSCMDCFPVRTIEEVEYYQVEADPQLAMLTVLKGYQFLTSRQLKDLLAANPQ